jgi:hypothetical protein
VLVRVFELESDDVAEIAGLLILLWVDSVGEEVAVADITLLAGAALRDALCDVDALTDALCDSLSLRLALKLVDAGSATFWVSADDELLDALCEGLSDGLALWLDDADSLKGDAREGPATHAPPGSE